MISLSNVKETIPTHKVIQLQEIDLKQEREVDPFSNEEYKEAIHDDIIAKINHAKEKHDAIIAQNEQLMEEVQTNITAEKEAWQIEKESLKKAAYNEGYEAGFAKGEQAAKESYTALIAEANAIVKTAHEEFIRTVDKHKLAIGTLAVKTAEKILTTKLEKDPAYFMNIVRETIDELKDKPSIEIMLHPDDYELVMEQKDELEEVLVDEATLTVQMNVELNKGDCILTYPHGQIDCGIDLQLRQIKNALAEKIMESL